MKILVPLFVFMAVATQSFAMDQEKYLGPKKLSAYATLVIQDFDVKHVEIEHIDADEMKSLQPMLPKLVHMLSSTVEKKLQEKKKFQQIVKNEKKTANAVILEGKIEKLNGGIGGVKWLLGVMAPKNAKTFVQISGRLVDAATGKEVAVFADTNQGTWYAKNFEDYFPEMAEEIGEGIAEFIENNY